MPNRGASAAASVPGDSACRRHHPGGFAITWGLDDKLKTPYSHMVDFAITRELPSNFVFEASYVGRFAHRLLQEEDLAEPVDLVDPKTGMDYFHAVQALAKLYNAGVPIQNITPANVGQKAYQYWQDIFPAAAGPAASQIGVYNPGVPCLGTAPATVTATQACRLVLLQRRECDRPLCVQADVPGLISPTTCFPACATINGNSNPFTFYSPQFSSLFAWRSIGNSSYSGGQFSLRHHAGGLAFDINYTYSKSIDIGSNAERINEFEGGGSQAKSLTHGSPNSSEPSLISMPRPA